MAQMCRVIVIAVLMDAAVIEKWGGLNGGIAEVWVHDDRGNDEPTICQETRRLN